VKIITAPGSTYDPIAIASNAPTPVKKLKFIKGLRSKTIRCGAPDTNAEAGFSKKVKTVLASTTIRAGVVQGKKRACSTSSTSTPNKEQRQPAYLGKVVNVSDFKDSDDE